MSWAKAASRPELKWAYGRLRVSCSARRIESVRASMRAQVCWYPKVFQLQIANQCFRKLYAVPYSLDEPGLLRYITAAQAEHFGLRLGHLAYRLALHEDLPQIQLGELSGKDSRAWFFTMRAYSLCFVATEITWDSSSYQTNLHLVDRGSYNFLSFRRIYNCTEGHRMVNDKATCGFS